MNIYERKPISSVLLGERIIGELRNIHCEIKQLQILVSEEIKKLKENISGQNQNNMSYENLRSLMGNSKSAIITFSKATDSAKRSSQTLRIKNNTYSGEKFRNCCTFPKYKNSSTTSIQTYDFNTNPSTSNSSKAVRIERKSSNCRKSSFKFDYVKQNNEVTKTSLMVYRLEKVLISEVQKIGSAFDKLHTDINKQFNKHKISEHYTGNRYRNAQVREDFPCALDEQLREQRLAEQAAALYHQMIAEQEEQDALVAKQLADKIEREELAKKRAIEQEDEEIARQLLERERLKQQRIQSQSLQQSSSHLQHIEQHSPLTRSPRKPDYYESPRKVEHAEVVRQREYHESPKRQGYLMPLPSHSPNKPHNSGQQQHYRSSSDDLLDPFQQCSIADALELGLPVDEIDERRMQEERDAELARKLQEQESSVENIQLNRDRLMAIEAQDKELAKLLQEREKAKVRRAKERAKQKALAKKQQMELNPDQILPDDSYSNPIDLLQNPECSHHSTSHHPHNPYAPNCRLPIQDLNQQDDDANYSYPVDVLPPKTAYDHNLKQNYSPQKNYDSRLNGYNHKSEIRAMNGGYLPGGSTQGLPIERELPAIRPTQLDLKSPISKSLKPRSPDPDSIEICDPIEPDPSFTQHANIAMAIDPTYSRRTAISQTPSSQDTSTLSTTSTTSSTTSPAISLPPPDLSEDELSPVPPYMPIQGQRRTASLEKKKKRAKDGCKQQ